MVGLMPNGTMRARLVTPAAEPRSSDLTIAMVKEARNGLSMYAKNERITISAAATVKVGANGRQSQISDARPCENAMVRTTPIVLDIFLSADRGWCCSVIA